MQKLFKDSPCKQSRSLDIFLWCLLFLETTFALSNKHSSRWDVVILVGIKVFFLPSLVLATKYSLQSFVYSFTFFCLTLLWKFKKCHNCTAFHRGMQWLLCLLAKPMIRGLKGTMKKKKVKQGIFITKAS